jgi:6-pyruvoyl-tetrahydropterin synthase
MVMDFGDLSQVVKTEILDLLDHRHLNDILDNPTCERLLAWIAEVLAAQVPDVDELVLWETDTACAILRRGDEPSVLLRTTRPLPNPSASQ